MNPTLSLFHVDDDPLHMCLPGDNRWQCLVWATTERDAKLVAASVYTGDGPVDDMPWEGLLDATIVSDIPQALLTQHAPPWPRIERNPYVLRLAGWQEGDEYRCECCNLAPMGLPAYALCPECEQCPECGHAEECAVQQNDLQAQKDQGYDG